MREKLYIGESRIKSAKEVDTDEGKQVNIIFYDGQQVQMSKLLYELVKSDVQNEGKYQDMVFYKVASKFVLDMVDLGLTCLEVGHVMKNVTNIVENSHKETVAEKFGVKDPSLVKLSQIIKD